jgi:hypothetical protein
LGKKRTIKGWETTFGSTRIFPIKGKRIWGQVRDLDSYYKDGKVITSSNWTILTLETKDVSLDHKIYEWDWQFDYTPKSYEHQKKMREQCKREVEAWFEKYIKDNGLTYIQRNMNSKHPDFSDWKENELN